MTRYKVAVLALMGALLTLLACGSGADDDRLTTQLEAVRVQLEIGDPLPQQEPFVIRDFTPTANEQPILNGVAYGCHRDGQSPWGVQPSREELAEDLRIIAQHWPLLRVYNADDNAARMLEIITEEQLPLQMMLGVWLDPETSDEARRSNITNVVKAIELARRYPQIVVAVNVGNETQVDWSAHRMPQETLVCYLRAVRSNIEQPVTTADDYNFWNKPPSRDVASEVDFIVTHAHPVWNGKTLATACDWLTATIDAVAALHPNKQIVLGETGWATAYNPDKTGPGEQGRLVKGEVSVRAQAEFLNRLDRWVSTNRVVTFFFEAFDESWKGGADATGPEEIEKNWGVFCENRQPKASFEDFVSNRETTNTYEARGE